MIKWVRNGEALELDRKPFILFDHDGFGIPRAKRIEEMGVLQHGATDKGVKLPSRDIVLYIKLFAVDWRDYYARRMELAKWFSPFGEAGKLVVNEAVGGIGVFPDSGGLEISGFAIDGLDFAANDRAGLTQTVPIVIRCADPFWKDAAPTTANFSAGGGGDTYTIPAAVPFTIGASVMDVTQYIDYRGDAEAYPVIRIYGAVTSPVLTHNSTGAKLDLTGTTIGAGDWYEFDLSYGVKTLKDSAGVNKISALSADSALATFKLLPVGENAITATGTGITAATAISFTWRNAYSGI